MSASIDFVSRILDELGSHPTAQTLVGALVPEAADCCIVYRRRGNGYEMTAWAHIDPAKGVLLDKLATIHTPATDDPRDPIAFVGRTGQGVLVSTVTRENIERATDDERVHAIFDAFGPRNIVVVPVPGGEYVIVAAVSDTPRSFYEDDLEFLTQIASRVGPLLA